MLRTPPPKHCSKPRSCSLLEREPKEAILRKFELPVIERYFPEYVGRIGHMIGGVS